MSTQQKLTSSSELIYSMLLQPHLPSYTAEAENETYISQIPWQMGT